MKVTKVEKTRIAVSANNVNGDGRGFLYPTPNEENSVQTVEKQLEKRVFSANKMYGVFFPSDIPRELEMHFCEIVKLA